MTDLEDNCFPASLKADAQSRTRARPPLIPLSYCSNTFRPLRVRDCSQRFEQRYLLYVRKTQNLFYVKMHGTPNADLFISY